MSEVSAVDSPAAAPSHAAPAGFTRYQGFVVAMLAFLQFTLILDFMILSPLGAVLLQELHITPSQFGLVVSVYAFSAGGSGLLAAGFADRFDRKKLLLFFYTGFLLGTLMCGLAPTYEILLLARMVTGIFGGVIGSIVLAIVADLFVMQQRGRVMGYVQSAFAASQVMGLPLGLYLSNHWGWHAPFLMILAVGVVVGVVIVIVLRPINAHLALQTDTKPLRHLFNTVKSARYLGAFATTALLVTGGFMLMPFGSAFSVNNLGISLERLPMVYMATGVSAMILGPLSGRLSDSFGKYNTFVLGSVVSLVIVLIYTQLGVTPLWEVIALNILLFAGISSRMVSSSALMSAVPEPKNRGAFMAVSASVQQFAGGLASAAAGLIVVQASTTEPLQHYEVLGYIVAAAIVVTVVSFYFIHRMVARDVARKAAA